MRRTKRSFSDSDKIRLLKDLKACRDACVRTTTTAPIQSDIYELACKLMAEIDMVIEYLTGHKDYFHDKPHSTL